MCLPWRDYKSSLVERYGKPVYRIGIDGGFSCPNRNSNRTGGCIYCDAKGSSAVYQRRDESRFKRHDAFVEDIDNANPKERPSTLEERKRSITAQIEQGCRFLDRRYPDTERSIYFQAFTSTYDDPAVLGELYHHALDSGSFRELIVSTRPDCLSDAVLEVLQSCAPRVDAVWVELGLQSGNDETLAWIGRGHSVQEYREACARLHAAGFLVSVHVILGLPGESDEHIGRTARVLTASAPEALKIHNLHVVSGTRLFEMYQEGTLHVVDMSEHLRQVIFLLRRIPADTVIQRFLSDTPSHRLAAPRDFGDKNTFMLLLRKEMERLDVRQGDLL